MPRWPGELAVVVAGGVQRHAGIGNVVAQVGREAQNPVGVLGLEGGGELVFHAHHVPGHNAVAQQRVFAVAGHGVGVLARQLVLGAVAVAVHVEKVLGGLAGHQQAARVGPGGIHRQVVDVGLVKANHARRQRVHGQPVQQPVAKKAPGLRPPGHEEQGQTKQQQKSVFFHGEQGTGNAAKVKFSLRTLTMRTRNQARLSRAMS